MIWLGHSRRAAYSRGWMRSWRWCCGSAEPMKQQASPRWWPTMLTASASFNRLKRLLRNMPSTVLVSSALISHRSHFEAISIQIYSTQIWIGNFPTDLTRKGFTSCNCCTKFDANTNASTAPIYCLWRSQHHQHLSKCATTFGWLTIMSILSMWWLMTIISTRKERRMLVRQIDAIFSRLAD